MHTFAQFITEAIKGQNAYWYNIHTKKLHVIPDYNPPPGSEPSTDWHGHNAWSSAPGHHAKLGLTADEGEVLRTVRDDQDTWEDHEVPFRKATEKVWQNNVRVLVAYYTHGPSINMQFWDSGSEQFLSAAHHILDLLAHREKFATEDSVYMASYHCGEDFGTTVGDVLKSHTMAELKKRSKRVF